ncbi:MAG TPA: MG2 domain-containing protein [Burkholderiaceae bacterium]|nr:MG2 domain-containing protein [Burkholderiaceae bacterium]
MRIRNVAVVLLLSLVAAVAAQDAAKVESFSPQGQVKDVRQVVARFSQPMVSFGDPRSEAPFDIECAALGKNLGRGRWADARNWLYDFDQDLPAGIECNFKTKPGLKTFAGAEVAAQTFRFSTGGPSIRGAWPDEGEDRIDEAQVFMLALDAHADLASVRANAYCVVDGIGERLPLAIIEGKERERILGEQKNRARVLFEVITKRGNRGIASVRDQRLVDAPILVSSCGRPLPAGSNVRLVWGAGIKTVNGIMTTESQTLPYQVRPQFSARFTCQRVNANAGCIPVLPAQLEFTAPVARDIASKIELRGVDGAVHRPTIDSNVATVDSVEFKGPFAERSEATILLPGNLKDDAGRTLANTAAFPMKVRIDDDPPLVKFPSRFGILEVNAQPALPVTVRNVEPMLDAYALDVAKAPKVAAKGRIKRIDTDDDAAVAQWMRRILREPSEDVRRNGEYLRPGSLPMLSDIERTAAQPIDIPRAEPKMAMQVIGIPLPQTGLYAVEIASKRLGQALHAEDKPYYVSGGALVTNLAVHFKHGRESSLAWVTRLDDGKPVAGAQVRVTDCLGKRWWDGATDGSGIARIAQELPPQNRWRDCPHASNAYLVSARIDGDMSLMLTSWNEGIRPWQFSLGGGSGADPVIAHTVFDRALFRAGETVSMKHVIRRRVGSGFAAVETRSLPRQLQLIHSGSGQKFELPATWNNGTALSTWSIPKDAKLGEYTVLFVDPERGRGRQLQSGAFRVEQFRVPLMKAVLKPPSKAVVNPTQVSIDAQLSYLSGGPAAGAPVKFRSRVVPSSQSFPEYDEFSFGGAVPKVGIEAEAPYDEDRQDEPEAIGGAARVQNVSLDVNGGARVVFDKLAADKALFKEQTRALEVEMEYADPNGQILTAFTQTLLSPSAVVVGLALDGSTFKRDSLKMKAVVLDNAGKPQVGKDVTVDAYSRTRFAYRKRLLGGFYAYEQTVEVKRLKQVCRGTTDARGLVRCSGPAPASGDLILVARADDAQGNAAIATRDVYVAGSDDSWFEAGQSDRIDLIADKRSYEPGETARYEVRMPYRTATALITVEREGVLESRVATIDSKSPYIEVPMLGHYGPNAYVTALVVRGRIEPELPGKFAWLRRMIYRAAKFIGIVDEVPVERDTRPTALVDLTKPSYRLGMAQVKVGWKAYELRVKVEPEKPVYKVRDRAAVIVTVTDPNGKPMANAELAVAAVDEGLLALASNRSWDLLSAMMQRRPIEVETSTAQSQVIGKRHFGKKAVAAGGGGGGENARELFDTLLMWNPRVTLDENGRARVEVPLNDSLTSFRIEAIANTTTGESRFGSGGAAIRTTQDVMMFAGLPPFVREGDRFDAQVTVRNGADRPLELAINATMNAEGAAGTQLPASTLSLAAGGAQTISLPAQVPYGAKQLRWQITAREMNAAEVNAKTSDTIKISQNVGVAVPVRVYQQTLLQLEPAKATSFPVELPKGAIAGRGGVEVKLARSLGGSAETIQQWMAAYPFTCLEQRASVAVALEDPLRWQRVMDSLPALLDRDGLAKYFPSSWPNDGDDTLTSYLLTIANEAGYEIPEAARERMLRGLADFVAGRVVRYTALPTADLAIRKVAAIEALARYGKAEPRMLESIEIAPNLWPTSAVLDWMSLLKKLQTIPKRNERLAEVQQILRSRMTFSGTTLVFSTEKSDYLWWLMVSPDRNAVRALALLSDDASFKEEMPRMARGALSRQQAGKWNTTLANAWGVLALRRFQSRFEGEAVTGRSIVSVGNDPHSLDWKTAQSRATNDPTRGTPVGAGVDTQFAWPTSVESLSIVHEGSGRPWAFITSRAALPLQAPLFAGYQIKRTVTPVEQKTANVWARGDTYRVTLEVDAQADMTWVVVSDPIPTGAAVLGSGLGGDSRQLVSNERRDGMAWPAYEERAFDGFRAYYRYVPKGKLKLEYTVRLNNAGAFSMPPTRVEAMYAPESFAELPVAALEVRP